ncbi:MAG: hypothetical protein JJV98_06485 [Desulfosarcina sp.]|nr:hypothetical protein [Desulfobacterales bacterium]
MNAYSSFWRRNRSGDEVTEHVLCLRALRKVAGSIGRNVKPVYWKGMVENDNRSIILDSDTIKGEYPVSFTSFDILVGQVALEALSTLEWGDWVTGKVINQAECEFHPVLKYMKNIIRAAEDIYIDHLARSSVWSLYLARFWQSELKKNRRDPNLPPSPSSLADAWRSEVILGERLDRMHSYYYRPLEILNQHTDVLRKIVSLPLLSERRSKRSELYVDIWHQIVLVISEWEIFQSSPDAVNLIDESALSGDACENPDEGNDELPEEAQEHSDTDSDLIDRIKDAVNDAGKNDLSNAVAVAIEDPEAGEMETIIKQGTAISDIQPDAFQVQRLRDVFIEHRHQCRCWQKKVTKKRLNEGKVDSRRLYRAPLDGRIFKKKETIPFDASWHICIVADASASMGKKSGGNRPWQTAEKTFVALANAAKGFSNLIDICAYCEDGGVCVLTRLYHDETTYTVVPRGRTPSGQAITAAALSLNNNYKNRLIIHISDGAANCGLNMGFALEHCRSNDIGVFAIGCGCNVQTKDFLRGYFSVDQLCFVDNIISLPEILERLFQQKMLDFFDTRNIV